MRKGFIKLDDEKMKHLTQKSGLDKWIPINVQRMREAMSNLKHKDDK